MAAKIIRRQGSPLWLKIFIGVVAVMMFSGVLYVTTTIFGHVSGVEFSPETFSRRDFLYYEIPLVRLKVTPIMRSAHAGPVEDLVLAEKHITAAASAKTWDLVYIQKGAASIRQESEAQVLAFFLDATDHGSASVWAKWSEQNPTLAAELWPVVQKYAQSGLYLQLPPLFRLAREATSASELKQELQREMATVFTEVAARAESLGNPERGKTLREQLAELPPPMAEAN